MRFSLTSRFLILLTAAALLTACFKDNGTDPVDPINQGPGCLDGSNIKTSIDSTCALPGDSTYNLQGVTFVKSGATLTIGAGAVIKGKADGSITALVVQPGARLIAVGTSTKPIVFTPGTSAPERGDFGGVILLGKAKINVTGGSTDIEGLTGVPYGGSDDDDSSGVLQYVRIEYAGHLLGADNEINGLTMGGVGRKTQISYVQVFEGLDDCFEWFGGAVSGHHLSALGCDDDMFDWDQGWSGNLQFAVGGHTAVTNTDANGIEADNLNGSEDASPRSNPKVANLTLIGNGSSSLNGMRLRRGTGGHIANAIVTGFKNGAAVRVDGNASIGLVNSGGLKGEGIYAYGNGSEVNVAAAAGLADSAATVAAARTKIAGWFTSEIAPLGVSLSNPRPSSAPPGAVTTPSGLQSAAYIGAYEPGASLWTEGWARSGSGDVPATNCLQAGNALATTITASCALPGDRTYTLQGVTFVQSGATLTIGAGAVIKGKADGSLTALVVAKGGRLIAVGTASKPIVFTPGTSAPERGDFGGVILLGNAKINVAGGSTDIEGLVGVPYGGDNDDDSSGVLQYVRIEYAGHLLGADNEINGLTMGGVGRKTRISHVQVFEALDDCFEWFGGAVSAKHLVALGCDDDMFDWDQGWSGNLQFAFGAHALVTNTDANGIEADNLNGNEDNLPRSAPRVANITLVGNNASSLNGMRLRRGTGGLIVNALVTGFRTGAAVRVDGNASIRLVNNDSLKAQALYAYNNGRRRNVAPAAGLPDSANALAAANTKIDSTWFTTDTSGVGVSVSVFKPTAAPAGAVAVPSGLDSAAYIGAFDPAASALWSDGWVRKY